MPPCTVLEGLSLGDAGHALSSDSPEIVCRPRGEANAGALRCDLRAALCERSCRDLSSAQRMMMSVGYMPCRSHRQIVSDSRVKYKDETHDEGDQAASHDVVEAVRKSGLPKLQCDELVDDYDDLHTPQA